MYYKVSILLCLLMSKFLDGSAQQLVNIGDKWHGEINTKQKILLMPPLDLQNKIDFQYKDMPFTGAVLGDNVIYISTSAPGFEISGSKFIGQKLSSFANKKNISIVQGWGAYLPIDKEWYAGFDYRNVCDSSKVLFVFKSQRVLPNRVKSSLNTTPRRAKK